MFVSTKNAVSSFLLLITLSLSTTAQEYIYKWNFEAPVTDWKVNNNSQFQQLPVAWFTGMEDPENYCGDTPLGTASSYMCTGFTPYDRSGSTLSKWLISPILELQNGDQISFYTSSAYVDCIFGQRANRMKVRLATNVSETAEPNVGTLATDVGEFTILLEDINPNYETASIFSPTSGYPMGVWVRKVYTISGLPANKKVKSRVGLQYFIENAGDEGCGDMVEIPGGPLAHMAIDFAAELLSIPSPNDILLYGGALVTFLTYNGGVNGTYVAVDEFVHNPIDVYVSTATGKEIFNNSTASNTPHDSLETTMYENLSCGFGEPGKPKGREFYVHNYGPVTSPITLSYTIGGTHASMFNINDNGLTGPLSAGLKRPVYFYFEPPTGTAPGTYSANITVTTSNSSFPTFSFNINGIAYSKNDPPTVYCHDSIAVSLGPDGTATIVVDDVLRSANDDCSNWDQWTTTISGDVSFDCSDVSWSPYVYNETFVHVTDDKGATGTCRAQVYVSDRVVPSITCPPSDTIPNSYGYNYGTPAMFLNASPAVATDNCGTVTVTHNAPAQLAVNVYNPYIPNPNAYWHSVTWTATDEYGSTATCNQAVKVVDIDDPIIHCRDTVKVGFGVFDAFVTPDMFLRIPAFDNVKVQNIEITDPSKINYYTSYGFYYDCAEMNSNRTVTVKATDLAGNSATCNSIVKLVGANAACKDSTIILTNNGTVTLSANDVVAGRNPSCAIYGVTFSPDFLTCADQGVNIIDVTVEDQEHNLFTCQSKIEVHTFSEPPSDCGDTVLMYTSFNQSGGEHHTFNPPSKNLCAGLTDYNFTLTGANNESGTTKGNFTKYYKPGVTNVELSMYNLYDSTTTTCRNTVIVIDTFPPAIAMQIGDSTYQADPEYCYYFGDLYNPFIPWTITHWNVVATGATDFTVHNMHPQGGAGYVRFNIGVTHITALGYDESGNSNSISYDITVLDYSSLPIAVCPIAGESVWDGVKWVPIDGNHTENEGLFCEDSTDFRLFSPIKHDQYPHCLPWTWSYKIMTDWYSGAPIIDEQYNLSEQTPYLDIQLLAGENPLGNNNAIKLTVTNATGDSTSCYYSISNKQVINLFDVKCAENTTVITDDGECTASYLIENPVADLCDNYVWHYSISGATQILSGLPPTLTQSQGDVTVQLNPGMHDVYVGYSKIGGTILYCHYTVNVTDVTAPKVTCPADYGKVTSSESSCSEMIGTCQVQTGFAGKFAPSELNYQSSYQGYEPSEGGYTLNVSNAPSSIRIDASNSYNDGYLHGLGVEFRIPVDCNGNFSFTWEASNNEAGKAYPFLVIPNHTSAPYHLPGYNINAAGYQTGTYSGTLSKGEHIYLGLNDSYTSGYLKISNLSGVYFQQDAGLPVVAENCDYTFTSDAQQEYPLGISTINYTYKDTHGNTKTCEQKIHIQDIYTPVITCQDATIYIDNDGYAELSPLDVLVNCGSSNDSVSKSIFDCSNIGANVVTVISKNYYNAQATCNATVTVADNIAPVVNFKKFTVTLDGNSQGSVNYSDLLNSAADNCGIDTIIMSPAAFNCTNFGENEVTITVTDYYGTQTVVSGIVFVQPTGFAINSLPIGDVICSGDTATLFCDVTGATGLQWEVNEQKWSSMNDGSMPGQVIDRSSVAVGGGNVYVAYYSGGQTNVKMWNGSNWSTLGSSFSSSGTVNIVYSNGKPCIFYSDGDYINFRAYDGSDWSNFIQIYAGTGHTATNLYAIAGENNPQITVMYSDNSTYWLGARFLYYNNGSFTLLGNYTSSGDPTNGYFSVAAVDYNYYWVFKKQDGYINIMQTDGSKSWTNITTGDNPVVAFTHEQTPFPNTQVPYLAYMYGGNIIVKKYSNNSWVQVGSTITTNYTANALAITFVDTLPMLFYSENTYAKLHGFKFDGDEWVRIDTIENARFRDFQRIPIAVSGDEIYTFSTHSDAYKLSPWSPISGATAAELELANVTSSKSYRCKINSSCGSTNTDPVTVKVKFLPEVTVSDMSALNPQPFTFTAQIDSGSVNWYDTFESSTALATGLTFTTPDTIDEPTSYYAEGVYNGCRTERQEVSASVIFNESHIIAPDTLCLDESMSLYVSNPKFPYVYTLFGTDINGNDSLINSVACQYENMEQLQLIWWSDFKYDQTFKVRVDQVIHDAVQMPYGDDYIDFDVTSNQFSDAITVESWVYNNPEYPEYADFLEAQQRSSVSESGDSIIWFWDNGEFQVRGLGEDEDGNRIWNKIWMPQMDTGWTHVASVAGTNGMYIYYNGVLVASDPTPITDVINSAVQNTVITLGKSPGGNSQQPIDEFRIWNTARTQSQISSNMNSCLTGTEQGLIQYTNFSDLDADSVYSIKGSNGKLHLHTFYQPATFDGTNICEGATVSQFIDSKSLVILQSNGIKSTYSYDGCVGTEFYVSAVCDTVPSWYTTETGGSPIAVGDTAWLSFNQPGEFTTYVQGSAACKRSDLVSYVYEKPEILSVKNDTACMMIYADFQEDFVYNDYTYGHSYYTDSVGGVETDPWEAIDSTDYILKDTILLYAQGYNWGCNEDKRHPYYLVPKKLDAPYDLQSTVHSNGTSVDLIWNSNVSCIDYFMVRYRLKNTTSWKFEYASTYDVEDGSPITIGGLKANSEYEWRVAAFYELDEYDSTVTPISDYAYFTTGCSDAIAKPVNNNAWATTTYRARVTWNSATCIDSSIVRYRPKGTSGWKFASNPTSVDTTELMGLTAGLVYEWRVQVYNSGVQTPLSDVTEFCTAPASPGGLTADVGYHQGTDRRWIFADVAWTTDYSTCEIDSVVVRYRPTFTQAWKFATLPAEGGRLKNLIEDQTYVWRAIAFKNGLRSVISVIDTFSTANPSVRLAGEGSQTSDTEGMIFAGNASIFPNPFSEVLNVAIDLTESSNVTLELYSLSGNLVDIETRTGMSAGPNLIRYTPSVTTSGLYLMKIISNHDVKVFKLLKE